MEKRNEYIDILKGIGIISIVIGHASTTIHVLGVNVPIGRFVYLYHLAIFFFCSGYLYLNTYGKFGDFVVKKIKGLYIPAVKYSFFFLFIYKICNILQGKIWKLNDLIIEITNILAFNGGGMFFVTYWFFQILFGSILIFAGTFEMPILVKNKKCCYIIQILLCILIGMLGIFSIENHLGLLFNLQVAYLMVPVIGAGYCFKKWECILKRKLINIPMTIISTSILAFVIVLNIGDIELSKFLIINKWMFYPTTFWGIIFCLNLANILKKSKLTRSVCLILGRNSLSIMVYHVLGFKLIDYVYTLYTKNSEALKRIPYGYSKLWLAYYIVGLTFPLLMNRVFKYGREFVLDKR